MSYSVSYNQEGFISITIAGELTREVAIAVIEESFQIAQQHNCNLVLNDSRKAIINIPTLVLNDLPNQYSEIASRNGIKPDRLKRAIVTSKDLDGFYFFELISSNSKQNIKVFTDIESAQDWLFQT